MGLEGEGISLRSLASLTPLVSFPRDRLVSVCLSVCVRVGREFRRHFPQVPVLRMQALMCESCGALILSPDPPAC